MKVWVVACVVVSWWSPPARALSPVVSRRSMMATTATTVVVGISPTAVAKCTDIDSCREEGDRRFEEAERKAGPTVRLSDGVRYREMEVGTGPKLEQGDGVDLRFQVLKGNGDFMYGVPNREPGASDLSEVLKIRIGDRDVPAGVEAALVGAAKGARRRVELPPGQGFATSDWRPAPVGYAGIQRMKRFRSVLEGNGLQPGYAAVLLFEFEVVRVRKKKKQA